MAGSSFLFHFEKEKEFAMSNVYPKNLLDKIITEKKFMINTNNSSTFGNENCKTLVLFQN